MESFSTQYQGQHQELEQLRSKIRQAECDRQLAVNKAKLLEEELNSQQKLKAHEDKLRQLEEHRVKEQQEREMKRQREAIISFRFQHVLQCQPSPAPHHQYHDTQIQYYVRFA